MEKKNTLISSSLLTGVADEVTSSLSCLLDKRLAFGTFSSKEAYKKYDFLMLKNDFFITLLSCPSLIIIWEGGGSITDL